MTFATFDKLAYVDALKAHGVAEDQARAHAAALDTALHDVMATKADLKIEIGAAKIEILYWVFVMFLAHAALMVAAMAALINRS